MVVRRKKTSSGKKLSAVAAPQTSEVEEKLVEEVAPVVHQVVEVVEEDSGVDSLPAGEASQSQSEETKPEEADQSVAPVDSVSEEKNVQEHTSEEPEKRKEMIDELYTSRKDPVVMPEISMHKNKSMHPMVVWAIVTVVVALLSGGMLFAVTKKMVSMPSFFAKPTPTPTPAPTATPTPTPAPVDKAAFKIQVLNGGGTPGAASKMKKALEDKGYKVTSTGNTDAYTYDTTEVHGKSTMTDAIARLKADLKDDYALGAVALDLPASSAADVQVIVGKE